MEAFKKLFDDAWGVRMEHILRNTLYALIEYGEAALPDILRMLSNKAIQRQVLTKVTNSQVKSPPSFNPL